MNKRIAILGSTGSIGKNALRVVENLGDGFEVVAIAANKNYKLLWEQAEKFRPKYVGIVCPEACDKFEKLPPLGCEILRGEDCLEKIAVLGCADIVLTAVVGLAGLNAVLSAVKSGKRVAIANKEPLAAAGALVMSEAKKSGAEILPVDSEHSALYQCMHCGREGEVERLILTSSGGPFYGMTKEELENVSLSDALAHPRWKMGKKISVDSATMMNKALEVLEARWLFDRDISDIDILIHPEAVIHSMVEFIDGSVMAQISEPDMCLPIQYALTYPTRVPGINKKICLADYGKLTFGKPDKELFPAMRLCYEVDNAGGLVPAVFNAANEAAVELFLAERIAFTQIMELVEKTLQEFNVDGQMSCEMIIQTDSLVRKYVYGLVE